MNDIKTTIELDNGTDLNVYANPNTGKVTVELDSPDYYFVANGDCYTVATDYAHTDAFMSEEDLAKVLTLAGEEVTLPLS